MSSSREKGIEGSGMKQAGGVAVSGNPPNSARPRQSCYSVTKASYDVPRAAAREFVRSVSTAFLPLATLLFMGSCGLLRLNPDPEVAPSGRVDRVWSPPLSISAANETAAKIQQLQSPEDNNAPQPRAQTYDLPALVDLALGTNPQTRRAWYAAQAANAQLGQSQAVNYPKIAFNRAIQDVVFDVEKAYYVLSAAKASVSAAESNLKLARTSLDAVQERHQMGLATHPQILLAKQVEAQAVYDLENAKSMVHDAESVLYEAIGVAPDVPITVQNVDQQNVPPNLSDDVETFITEGLKKRPDVAAQIAAIRAGDAAIAGAISEFYPEVGVSGNYGQIIWSYTVNGGHIQNLNQPFYGALLTLRWDLFTGFDRYYGVQKATAERNAARSELKSLELDVVATVWRAYYDFQSAKKKYDASEVLLAASEESYEANLESHR